MGLNLVRDRLCVLQFSNGDGNAYLIQFDGSDYSAPNLKKLLLNDKICKIFHFARFDLAAIKKYLGVELNNIFCTKIASKLCRTYTDYHGLNDLCKEILDFSISKQQQTSYWGAEKLTRAQQEYAANDVLYLHDLRTELEKRLSKLGRQNIANNMFKFLPTRVELDLLGWEDKDLFAHS